MPRQSSPGAELARHLKKYPESASMELLIADMNGILKGKRVRRPDFEKSVTEPFPFCGGTVLLTALGETVPGIPYGEDDGDPDVEARVVPGTIAPVPWATRPSSQAMFRMYGDDGKPFFADPRTVLERAIQPFTRRGLSIVMATELEFYLLRGDTEVPTAAAPVVPGIGRRQPGAQVYHPEDLRAIDPFLDDVYDWCDQQHIPADTTISEYGPGQFEVNLRHHDDPVRACDQAVLLKRVIKAAALKHGFVACFMAKPFTDDSGNGLHIHMSFVDREGRNYFSKGRDSLATPPFSAPLRQAVAGMLKTMPEATAVFCPNANSYRRLRPEMYAPVDLNWGVNHRAVAIRIPGSDATNLRFEHRVAGADANPYLVTAAVLAGVDYGLRNKLEPPRMVEQGESIQLRARIPTRWDAALDRFSRAKVLPEYLGADYCRHFLTNRRTESQRYHNEIPLQDFRWYLRSV
ncbi:MAG: glutamine synthetase family protein [Woeseiaceae bacterium]|jgi:glutamine synthetase|nr:glutamine synthetase family protein [Woeseiaceae bacterium]